MTLLQDVIYLLDSWFFIFHPGPRLINGHIATFACFVKFCLKNYKVTLYDAV